MSWQLTDTGDVDIVSPVALTPGESAVIESLKSEQGNATVTVEFANGQTGDFSGSGESCVFVPPVSTEPPATTQPATGISSGGSATAPVPAGELPQTGGSTTAPAPAPAGELPQTGGSTGVLAGIAAILLLAGGGALFATRRSTAQN